MSSGPAHGARRTGARAPGAVALAGALVLAASMVALGLSLRDLLDAGGACATGGPFAIENPCPDGVDLLLPVAGLAGFAGAVALAYGLDRVPGGDGRLVVAAWTALFVALGATFIEYGLAPPGGGGPEWAWLVPGVAFLLLLAAPGAWATWWVLRAMGPGRSRVLAPVGGALLAGGVLGALVHAAVA